MFISHLQLPSQASSISFPCTVTNPHSPN
jgi:hypothetical protein